jgi:hypothetical protein
LIRDARSGDVEASKKLKLLREKRKEIFEGEIEKRKELIEKSKLSSGGTTTLVLQELEESGFIIGYIPFDKNLNNSNLKNVMNKFIEHTKQQLFEHYKI